MLPGEGVGTQSALFQCFQPFPRQITGGFHAQMFMDSGIFFEIGKGEFQEGDGGLWPAFLHVHECAGQLNQTFVKSAVRSVFVLKPQMFQDFMGLVEQLFVETMKITEIMRIQ